MSHPVVVVVPPFVPDAPERELAMGFWGIWVSALFASGADVFAPHEPLPPGADPYAALGGMRGVSMTHDGGPPSNRIDAIVRTEIRQLGAAWQVGLRISQPDRPDFVQVRPARSGPSAPLRVMTQTLRDVTQALDLYVPAGMTWRRLLGVQSAVEAIEELRSLGRMHMERGTQEATDPVRVLH